MADASRAAVFPRRFVACAAALGLLVRLAFALLYWTGQPLTRDELEYLSLARSLAAGRGFTYDAAIDVGASTPFGRAPGYPAFLALTGGGRSVASSVPVSVKVAQSVTGALGVVLLAVLAARLGGARAAKVAAVLGALYPPLVWIGAFAWSEALFWPMALAIAWLFDRARTRPDRPALALILGLAVGAGILVRPALLVFVPGAALFLVWERRALAAAALIAGVVVVVGPWTARNVAHFGRLVLVASEGGVTFWTGNHPLAVGDGDLAANPAIKIDNARFRSAHPGLSEEALEGLYYKDALAWMRTHPADWLRLELRKAFYLLVPVGPSYTLHSMRYRLASQWSYLLLLAAAIPGAWRARRVLGQATGLWLLAASAIVVCLLFFPQERFRIPILDPALVVLGSLGIATLLPAPSRP